VLGRIDDAIELVVLCDATQTSLTRTIVRRFALIFCSFAVQVACRGESATKCLALAANVMTTALWLLALAAVGP